MRFNAHVLQTAMPPLVELPRRAAELAAGGADVIRVDQGAVDIPPPERFVQRVRGVLGDPEAHRYTPDPGLPELRSALARCAAERLGVECDPERELIVTAGANEAGFAALVTLLEPDDQVLLPAPWYFNQAMTLSALGAVPVPIPTAAEQGWAPEPDVLAGLITPRTRGIALVNPNNPTGAVYDDERIRQLVKIAIENDLWFHATRASRGGDSADCICPLRSWRTNAAGVEWTIECDMLRPRDRTRGENPRRKGRLFIKEGERNEGEKRRHGGSAPGANFWSFCATGVGSTAAGNT